MCVFERLTSKQTKMHLEIENAFRNVTPYKQKYYLMVQMCHMYNSQHVFYY